MTAESVWTALFWAGVAALAAAGAAKWRMTRYPGTWQHAFAPRHHRDRHRLRAARHKLRRLEREAADAQERAHAAADRRTQDHAERVRQAEQRLAALREPGPGVHLHSLGDRLDLYEQTLRVSTGTTTTDHHLHRLTVDDQYSTTDAFVYLTPPGGPRELVTLPLSETPEAEVWAFVVRIHNAVADSAAAHARRRALIPVTEAELRRATAAATSHRNSRHDLDQALAHLTGDPRIPQAQRDLASAHDRWQELTGHHPD